MILLLHPRHKLVLYTLLQTFHSDYVDTCHDQDIHPQYACDADGSCLLVDAVLDLEHVNAQRDATLEGCPKSSLFRRYSEASAGMG